MTPHPEDPRITAYVLGELDENESAAIELAAETDPVIRKKIVAAKDIQRLLKQKLALPDSRLHPHQRDQIRRSASLASNKRTSAPRRFPRWLIPLAGAAAVVVLTTFLIVQKLETKPTSSPQAAAAAPPPASESITDSAPPTPPPAPVHASIENPGFLSAIDFPTLNLPIHPGKSKLSPLTQSIREANQLPPHADVRLEEILNSFSLRLNGTSSIARSAPSTWHPDKRDSGINTHLATLSTEMIACPWKPSATLLLISVRANDQKDCDLQISFKPNADNVVRYRLLGFNPDPAVAPLAIPTLLPAGAYSTLAIEIDSSKPAGELGSLVWSANGTLAPPIPLVHKPDAEPSDDARFATLVCSYAQWLAGEQAGIIDKEILSALVRENTSVTIPPSHAEFIALVDASLQLQTH